MCSSVCPGSNMGARRRHTSDGTGRQLLRSSRWYCDSRVIPANGPERNCIPPEVFQATWSTVTCEPMRRVNERVPYVQYSPRLVVKAKSGGGAWQRWSGSPNCSPSGVRACLPPSTDHCDPRPPGSTIAGLHDCWNPPPTGRHGGATEIEHGVGRAGELGPEVGLQRRPAPDAALANREIPVRREPHRLPLRAAICFAQNSRLVCERS